MSLKHHALSYLYPGILNKDENTVTPLISIN